MNEFSDLKSRVEQAVGKLSNSHDQRHEQNQNLTKLLGDLEIKFDSRTEELEYCNLRISALTEENNQLTGLLDRLVSLIENDPESEENDPLFRASEMAAALINSFSEDGNSEAPASEPMPVESEPVAEAPGDLPMEDLPTGELTADAFEDVSAADLATELDAETDALPDMPVQVAEAVAAALALSEADERIDVIEASVGEAEPEIEMIAEEAPETIDEEPITVDIDIPEADMADEQDQGSGDEALTADDTEASIRAMMKRLEDAAANSLFPASDDGEAVQAPAVEGAEKVA